MSNFNYQTIWISSSLSSCQNWCYCISAGLSLKNVAETYIGFLESGNAMDICHNKDFFTKLFFYDRTCNTADWRLPVMCTSTVVCLFVSPCHSYNTMFCTKVVVNGQLGLHNSLSLPVEVRIVPESVDYCQSSLMVQSGASPPTVVLDPRHGYSLKVRFSSLSTFWSGEIPLKYTARQTKQWEVKSMNIFYFLLSALIIYHIASTTTGHSHSFTKIKRCALCIRLIIYF